MNKYERYENYDVVCGLIESEKYCKKYEGRPCCFFCKEKENCKKSCKNDPTICNRAFCKEKRPLRAATLKRSKEK